MSMVFRLFAPVFSFPTLPLLQRAGPQKQRLEEEGYFGENHSVVGLWSMAVGNFWPLQNIGSDLISSPHLQASGCLQVR